MAGLTVRKLPFEFEDVEFIWNPDNPRFSIDMNKLSFFAVGLERYFCRAIRDAEPLITDPAILEEAQDFRMQESIHSLAHRQHVKDLCRQYPGLNQALDDLIKHFDDLYDQQTLHYHLGYTGGLESMFTPVFKLFLDNRAVFFGKGDARVASLLLWHFCEEVEHRSSAISVYNHVVGKPWVRLRYLPSYFRHVAEGMNLLTEAFKQHVPQVPEEYYVMSANNGVPKMDQVRMLASILATQLPWHKTSTQVVPDYFYEWMQRYERGEDMTQVYGVPWKA